MYIYSFLTQFTLGNERINNYINLSAGFLLRLTQYCSNVKRIYNCKFKSKHCVRVFNLIQLLCTIFWL